MKRRFEYYETEQPSVVIAETGRVHLLRLITKEEATRQIQTGDDVYEDETYTQYLYETAWIGELGQVKTIAQANELVKEQVIDEINDYDKSSEVNSFYINGERCWLDKDTRVGLVNSINAQKQAGYTDTTIWIGNKSFTIDISTALQMLNTIEVYAAGCFNATASHIANVKAMTTAEEAFEYDYKCKYPIKPSFDV